LGAASYEAAQYKGCHKEKKMTKKRNLIRRAVVLGFVLSTVGCASTLATSLLSGPHPTLSSVNGVSTKTGRASSTVGFGFGKTTYPPIMEAAQKGAITKIASVEYYKRSLFFSLIVEYTTIVTGE
jgi:hypothetical protein